MSKTNYLFDLIALNQVIEDFDLEIKLPKFREELDIIEVINNSQYIKYYNNYRKQFNTKNCINSLSNGNIIIKYKDKDNNDRIFNIVDFILDILYNNNYLSEYQMLHIIRSLNNKLTTILFEIFLDVNDSSNNNINDVIEDIIY